MQLIGTKPPTPGTPGRGSGRLRMLARRLRGDSAGNSLIEFAFALPVLLTLGMYGIELAYMASVNMQVSQIATSLADNASRLGQTENSAVAPTITNRQIDSVMSGVMEQGSSIKFKANGRVILSSLEYYAVPNQTMTGKQYVHWRKCRGDMAQSSSYTASDYGTAGVTLAGSAGRTVAAPSGNAVMLVEAFYNYKPLFGTMFVQQTRFRQEAAFIVRDDRDLNQSSAAGVTGPTGQSEC